MLTGHEKQQQLPTADRIMANWVQPTDCPRRGHIPIAQVPPRPTTHPCLRRTHRASPLTLPSGRDARSQYYLVAHSRPYSPPLKPHSLFRAQPQCCLFLYRGCRQRLQWKSSLFMPLTISAGASHARITVCLPLQSRMSSPDGKNFESSKRILVLFVASKRNSTQTSLS